MEAQLFIFHEEFFNDDSSINDFIRKVYEDLKSKKSKEGITHTINHYIPIIKLVESKTNSEKSKNKLLICLSQLTFQNYYPLGDPCNLPQIISYLNKVNQEILDNSQFWAFHYISGMCNFAMYKQNHEQENFEYKLENLGTLFNAKKHLSKIKDAYLKEEISLDGGLTKGALFYWILCNAELNRWVEPFSLINSLEKNGSTHTSSVAKAVLLKNYREKTCCNINPLLLLRELDLLNYALREAEEGNPNLPIVESSILELNSIFSKNDINPKELEKYKVEATEEFMGHNHYQKFVIHNHLSLNEHALYCNCKASRKDDLRIQSSCPHTQIEWCNSYQLLLDQLKIAFDKARQSYFRATNKVGKKYYYKNTVTSFHGEEEIKLNPENYQLIDCFRECFSILDKVALGVDNVYELGAGKIHFEIYFRRKSIKKIINSGVNNLYLVSLFSIADELNQNSKYVNFPKFRVWRNAAEHNLLIPISNEANPILLKQNYPIVTHFVKESELKNKTFYLLQLCRSAIFSLMFLVRKVSIDKAPQSESQHD